MSANSQQAEVKPEGSCQRAVRLPAFFDDNLSLEAAQQLIEMSKDSSDHGQEGKEVPAGSKAEALARIR